MNLGSTAARRIALPPLEEQEEIIGSLHTAVTLIDRLGGKVQSGIARLHEYRTALISAAVTGKIDVREEVA